MNWYKINEDKKPQKINVVIARKIDEKIDSIIEYNHNNIQALNEWFEYIDVLEKYLSNPVIVFDYMNRYSHYPNGAIHLVEMGYDVSYIVKSNGDYQSVVS